jgi:predicted XRE-type DNA-binding protein
MESMKHGKMRQKNFIKLKQKLNKQVEQLVDQQNLKQVKNPKTILMMFRM